MNSTEVANGHQLWGYVVAWLLLGCGVVCFLFAEAWLVEPAYYAFGEFASRWWLALSLLIPIIFLTVLTGAVSLRAISAFRSRSNVASFIRLSAMRLGLGLIEVVVAVCIAIVALILLAGGYQVIPVVHVR